MAPMPSRIVIDSHTTASLPRPHILYILDWQSDGVKCRAFKRYSEFVKLHASLGPSSGTLPPKRILSTTFIPSKWADDVLITERKSGLQSYLNAILDSPQFRGSDLVESFLDTYDNPAVIESFPFDAEDALPSSLTRKGAVTLLAKLRLGGTDDGQVDTAAPPMIAAAYYPDWVERSHPPEHITFGKYDILFFSFAIPTVSGTMTLNGSLLQRLVNEAKNSGKNTRVVLSVGGWGGSRYFSHCVSTDGLRKRFSREIKETIDRYDLAGVDLDWEYPNSPGPGNPYSPSDSANYLIFLRMLRSRLGSSKIISAAVPHLPWLGSDGRPLKDLRAYASLMDFVNIMVEFLSLVNYDVWGASANPGPNAPLRDKCGTSALPEHNAEGALKAWTKAGFPPSKLLLGLPFYGYCSRSSNTTLSGSLWDPQEQSLSQVRPGAGDEGDLVVLGHPAQNGSPSKGGHKNEGCETKQHDTDENDGGVHAMADLSYLWGSQIAFNQLLRSDALKKVNEEYVGSGGFSYGWDNCSDTPFLYSQARQTVVTFDDPSSLAAKTKFAQSEGMAGCFAWSLDQDDGFTLMDAIRTAMGRPPPPASPDNGEDN